MVIYRTQKSKERKPRSPILLLLLFLSITIAMLFLAFSYGSVTPRFYFPSSDTNEAVTEREISGWLEKKYLYWGNRIDCPGKHCDSCEGLGHQESSLRCALEEAIFLKRWASSSCTMESLYDLDEMLKTVPVILDNSKTWFRILSISMKLGKRGITNVGGISRSDLRSNDIYSNVLLINRTASPLSWFMECKDRNNRSSVALPYAFLPLMAARKLRDVADKIREELGDYDAIHVRRGDKIKTRKDRFGVSRSLHPHLDRDTRPEFIQQRIRKWVPPGRTLFIASNERTPSFFSPLAARYKLAYSSNYSSIIDPVIENNYQLFMIERLILVGARHFIRTFKEDDMDLSLTDDPKKNTKSWQIPVYTLEDQ